MRTVQIAVRMPVDQLTAIDRLVGDVHASRSEVVRRAVELYMYRLACERDAAVYETSRLTDAELSLADDPVAWETTPAW